MPENFTIQTINPWSLLNEYEGELTGTIQGQWLTCYVQLYSQSEWTEYAPGQTIPVELWLERSGTVERCPAGTAASLEQVRSVEYRAVGTITALDGERLTLDTGFALPVDLDATPKNPLPVLSIGDCLQLTGILKIDPHLDDDD